MRNKINTLLTWQADKQKHINGAVLWSWLILIAHLFGGKAFSVPVIIVGVILAIVWEVTGSTKFSFIDVMAFVFGIAAVTTLILY